MNHKLKYWIDSIFVLLIGLEGKSSTFYSGTVTKVTLPAKGLMNVRMHCLLRRLHGEWVLTLVTVSFPFLGKHALITMLIFYLELASVFTSESGWQLLLLPLHLSVSVIRLFWSYTVIWGLHPAFYILEVFF